MMSKIGSPSVYFPGAYWASLDEMGTNRRSILSLYSENVCDSATTVVDGVNQVCLLSFVVETTNLHSSSTLKPRLSQTPVDLFVATATAISGRPSSGLEHRLSKI